MTKKNIGEKNRLKILDAATHVFAQNGFKGSSVQDIADAAQLPKTNVLYYYKSKHGLYVAVLDNILSLWKSGFEKATEADCPATVLSNYIREKMLFSQTHPVASRLFAMEILNGAPNLQTYFDNDHVEWMKGRTQLIRRWIALGKMKAVDPEYLLYQIWGSTEHYANFASQVTLLHGKVMSQQDYDEATSQLISFILNGCGLTPP